MTIHSFDKILVANSVLEKVALETLQEKFLGPSIGFNLERIGNTLSGRLSRKERLNIVFIEDTNGEKVPYVFHYDPNHKYDKVGRAHPNIGRLKKVADLKEDSFEIISLLRERTMIIEDPGNQTTLFQPQVILLDGDQT
jgi:hypothetical protein